MGEEAAAGAVGEEAVAAVAVAVAAVAVAAAAAAAQSRPQRCGSPAQTGSALLRRQ